MTTISSPAATLPYHQREWIDVEPGQYDNKSCFEVSKKDDQVASTRLVSTSRRRWSSQIQNLGSDVSFRIYVLSALVNSNMTELLKKRFQHCVDPYSVEAVLSLRAIQGPSGGKHINPSLQDNVFWPSDFVECINHVGSFPRSALDHSIRIDSGWPYICTSRGMTSWRSPGLQCTNTMGKDTKIECFCVVRGLLIVKDWSSIQRDQTRSSFTTLYLRCASKNGDQEATGEELYSQNVSVSCCTAKKCTEADLALWTPTSSDARTSFDHSSKHNEDCDVGTDKETCRGEKRLQNQPFGCPRARSYPPGSSPKVDSSVRDASE